MGHFDAIGFGARPAEDFAVASAHVEDGSIQADSARVEERNCATSLYASFLNFCWSWIEQPSSGSAVLPELVSIR